MSTIKTVRDLIAILQQLDPDAIPLIPGNESGADEIKSISTITVKRRNGGWWDGTHRIVDEPGDRAILIGEGRS